MAQNISSCTTSFIPTATLRSRCQVIIPILQVRKLTLRDSNQCRISHGCQQRSLAPSTLPRHRRASQRRLTEPLLGAGVGGPPVMQRCAPYGPSGTEQEPWHAESQPGTPGRGLSAILTRVPHGIDEEREGQQTFSVTPQRVNILGFAMYYSLIIIITFFYNPLL